MFEIQRLPPKWRGSVAAERPYDLAQSSVETVSTTRDYNMQLKVVVLKLENCDSITRVPYYITLWRYYTMLIQGTTYVFA